MGALTDVSSFIAALAAHWAELLIGGPPILLWLVWERLRQKPLSLRSSIAAFLIVGVLAASFQAWREEYGRRIQAQQMVASKRDANVVGQLQRYYSDASTYHRRVVADLRASDTDFDHLQDEIFSWSKAMGDWIMRTMGVGAFNRLAHTADYPLPYDGVSEQRREVFLKIANLRDNLGNLVENPSWDKTQPTR